MWIDRLNALFPAGLLKWRQDAGAFHRLGLGRWQAVWKACDADAASDLNWARLSYYPPGFLSSIRYGVDVGGNDGAWTRALLRYVHPEKWLVVEPNPDVAKIAAERLKSYAFVRLENCALADTEDEREFFVTEHSHNSSLLSPLKETADSFDPGFKVRRVEKIRVATLDSLLFDWPRVDLLKIDTQGNERDVLSGAQDTLKKTRAVLVEADFTRQYEGQSLFPEVHASLEAAGFAMQSIFPPAGHTGPLVWADAFYLRP